MSLWDYIYFIYIWSHITKNHCLGLVPETKNVSLGLHMFYIYLVPDDQKCLFGTTYVLYISGPRDQKCLFGTTYVLYISGPRWPKMSLWDYICFIYIWSHITKNVCLGLVPETKNVSLGLHIFYIYLVPDNQKSLSGTSPRDQKCLFGTTSLIYISGPR